VSGEMTQKYWLAQGVGKKARGYDMTRAGVFPQ
jgi:hypothetical protein